MTYHPDEITKYNNLIEKYESMRDNLTKSKTKTNPHKSKSRSESKQKLTKIHNNDIPFFQLMDDPQSSKTENKISYESAEAFVSTFETIIKVNDLDIDQVWNKSLPTSFLFRKNEKYVRWFQGRSNTWGEKTVWSIVKEAIIDRFGDGALINKIKQYINLKQGKTETVRDYVDRYLQAYSRLPTNTPVSQQNSVQDVLQVGMFIKSLLSKTRQEVEKSLWSKCNEGVDGTHYPPTLVALFKYLEKNIGDIQEALYISLTKTKNTINEPVVQHENTKRFKPNNFYQNSNTNNKNLKNACGFCKKEEFSSEHLKICIPYLNSETHKRILSNKDQKVQTYSVNNGGLISNHPTSTFISAQQ